MSAPGPGIFWGSWGRQVWRLSLSLRHSASSSRSHWQLADSSCRQHLYTLQVFKKTFGCILSIPNAMHWRISVFVTRMRGTKRFTPPSPLSSLCPLNINMNASPLSPRWSLAISHQEGKGSVCGLWHFYWISARFFVSWPRPVFTLISQTDHPRHILMSLRFVENVRGSRLWENISRRWELELGGSLARYCSVDVTEIKKFCHWKIKKRSTYDWSF